MNDALRLVAEELRPARIAEWDTRILAAGEAHGMEFTLAGMVEMVTEVFGAGGAANMLDPDSKTTDVYLWYYMLLFAELGADAPALNVVYALANAPGNAGQTFEALRPHALAWTRAGATREYLMTAFSGGALLGDITRALEEGTPVEYILTSQGSRG